jgi:hypothetical protein
MTVMLELDTIAAIMCKSATNTNVYIIKVVRRLDNIYICVYIYIYIYIYIYMHTHKCITTVLLLYLEPMTNALPINV